MAEKTDHDMVIELYNDMKWMREKVNSLGAHLWALTIPLVLLLLRFLFMSVNG